MDSPSIIVLNTDMPRGPQLSPKSSYIRYVKDCSSSYIQQESERNCDEILSQNISESPQEIKLANMTSSRRVSKKLEKAFKFTQIAKQNKIIEKFKNNLLQFSHIMPQKFKAKLQSIENYLQKEKLKKASTQITRKNYSYSEIINIFMKINQGFLFECQ